MGDLVAQLREVKKWITAGHGAVDLCEEAADAIERLNLWADGMTDAALKERRTGEEYQRELRGEIERLRRDATAEAAATCKIIDVMTQEISRLRAALERIVSMSCISDYDSGHAGIEKVAREALRWHPRKRSGFLR